MLAFEATGAGVNTGAAYDQRYLSIITTAGGRVVRYLNYWNPLVMVRALLGDAVADAIAICGIYHD